MVWMSHFREKSLLDEVRIERVRGRPFLGDSRT